MVRTKIELVWGTYKDKDLFQSGIQSMLNMGWDLRGDVVVVSDGLLLQVMIKEVMQ